MNRAPRTPDSRPGLAHAPPDRVDLISQPNVLDSGLTHIIPGDADNRYAAGSSKARHEGLTFRTRSRTFRCPWPCIRHCG